MRWSPFAVLVCTSLLSLACAGLPLPTADGEPEEQTDAADLAELDLADATPVTLATLEPTDEGCAWTARTWPGDQTVTIASARVACPTEWVSSAVEGHAAVLGQAGGALVAGDVASPLPAPPAAPEAVAFEGAVPWICARVEAERLEEPRRFKFEGQEFEAPDEGALARSWRFDGGAWVVGETAPVAVEGRARPCAELSSFPEGEVASAPAVLPDEDGFERAEGADDAALRAMTDGDWAVSADGWFAARWQSVPEGSAVRAPLAWRPEGGPWKLVEGAADGAVFFARGPWLLVVSGAESRLLDARTGQETFSATRVAALWPEGVSVPEAHPAGAKPAEPGAEPEPGGPATPTGPRAKAGKRPGAGTKAPGAKAKMKAQPVER